MQVTSGTLSLTGGVQQYVGSTLTAGTWVANSGVLDIPFSGTQITTLGPAATVSLIGPTASFDRIRTVSSNQGAFQLVNHNYVGSSFPGGDFTSSGTVLIDGGSYVQAISPIYIQAGGTTTLRNGALLDASVTVNGGDAGHPV